MLPRRSGPAPRPHPPVRREPGVHLGRTLAVRYRSGSQATSGPLILYTPSVPVDPSELTQRDDADSAEGAVAAAVADDQQTPPVDVVEIVFPAETGYTLRRYDNRDTAAGAASFLSRNGRLLLFRSGEGLARFLREETDHDLAGPAGWRERAGDRDRVADVAAAAITDGTVSRYELDLVPTNLAGSPDEWIPDLLLPARDLMAEVSGALDLRRIRASLADGEYLDRFDDALRESTRAGRFSGARRRLRSFESSRLTSQWRQLIRWLEQAADWRD